MTRKSLQLIAATLVSMIWLVANCWAQVNSGSNGSDGALDLTTFAGTGTNIVINMASHPTGIYQYTYVAIPSGVTVSFVPNASNKPLIWLVQSSCVISGTVDVSGQSFSWPGPVGPGGPGGPGGYTGGDGGVAGSGGQGPGGAVAGSCGQSASFATLSQSPNGSSVYGNQYLIPLTGGSGGGGCTYTTYFGGGGGGGGAILIAANQSIQLFGSINANGGAGAWVYIYYGGSTVAGGGSGGAVRLVSTKIIGSGSVSATGGGGCNGSAGNGRIRFDVVENDFSGGISGVFSQGSQFVIIPTAGQGAQLFIVTVGGVAVSASPTGAIATPDAVLSAQQNNPVPIVVQCTNIPLNTPITVSVTPMNGNPVSATGYNTAGTQASSTATIA